MKNKIKKIVSIILLIVFVVVLSSFLDKRASARINSPEPSPPSYSVDYRYIDNMKYAIFSNGSGSDIEVVNVTLDKSMLNK